MDAERPPLEPGMTEPEFLRWYWLRAELIAFARTLGVSTAGPKVPLADRIADHLAGRPVHPPPGRQRSAPQLAGPVEDSTVIGPGQRCSQVLREYFRDRVGPSFRFDAPMREFIATGNATASEAVEHWHATRTSEGRQIEPQFELNRFVRQWFTDHPGTTRAESLQAWRRHRALPADERSG